MRRIVVIAPNLSGTPESESNLKGNMRAVDAANPNTSVFRISTLPDNEMWEAACLGLAPHELQMEQGPLTVAALGHDPPARSVQFQLNALSLNDGIISSQNLKWPRSTVEKAFEQILRLRTRRLTPLVGPSDDHGLVLEDGSPETHCFSPSEAGNCPLQSVLPNGEEESVLRQFIDDSVNILDEQEFNHERRDQGLLPINLMWPWGGGFRMPVPNLLLLRGEPIWIESSSIRLSGLARLVKLTHGGLPGTGFGTAVPFEDLFEKAMSRSVSILLIESWMQFGLQGKSEESHWLASEFDRRFLAPILSRLSSEPIRLVVLSPQMNNLVGLGFWAETRHNPEQNLPFDERVLDDPKVPMLDLDQIVRDAVRPPRITTPTL